MTGNYQNNSERIIQEISGIRFLADFVFPNPQYRKGKIKRELADLIVAIGRTLIVFQIKTHFAKPQSPHDLTRAAKKLEDATRQFRTLLEGLRDRDLKSLRNSRGIEVPFNISNHDQLYLIVLLDYIGGKEDKPLRVKPVRSPEDISPFVFHALALPDFLFLTQQFDTIRDFVSFLDYLEFMELSYPELLMENLGYVVVHYKLYPDEIQELIRSGTPPRHLTQSVIDEIPENGLEEDGVPSYFFDTILSSLHSGVGVHSDEIVKEFSKRLKMPYNSAEAYWMGVSALADTSRWQRHHIGSLMLQKISTALEHGFAFGAIVDEKEKRAVLVYCHEASEVDLAKELTGLSLTLIGVHEIEFVVAVALPVDFEKGGLAMLMLRRDWVDDLDGLKNRVKDQPIFTSPRGIDRSSS